MRVDSDVSSTFSMLLNSWNMFNVIITNGSDHGCSDSGPGNPDFAIGGVVLLALRAQVETTRESHAPTGLLRPGTVTRVRGQIILRHQLIQLLHFTDGNPEAQRSSVTMLQ